LSKSIAAQAHDLELESITIGHKIARLETDIDKIERTEDVDAAELTQLLAEKSEHESRLIDAAAGIAEIDKLDRAGKEEARLLAARLESLRSESSALSRSLSGLISACAVKQERQSAIETDLRRLAAEAEDVNRRQAAGHAETESILERISGLEAAQEQARVQIESLGNQTLEAEALLGEAQKRLAVCRNQLAGLEERLRSLHMERENILGTRGGIEVEGARLESDIQHLERTCTEEFHVALLQIRSEIPEEDWGRDYDEMVRVHDDLRERVENFGAINMRALEEYQELDERYQFLTKQRSDIEQSIADTQKAIAEINRRSVEQFQDAFKNIRENFMQVFQILFKGGQCDLQLMDDGDVLESGIEIIAQPPGKRLQNVLLLSGGEKALTALALLIAIFRYRPSPFCVLDEVDAPLDDANVNRFTELISELSQDTQFIVVTHNKRTMEIAQTLYGVTMEEPGVSKIVGVDFRPRQVALAS
jgi:chromosome segregation protein